MITGVINEEWRSVSGFESYQVSNIGRVRKVETELILKSSLKKDGYYHIGLCNGESRKCLLIHRLVAQAFIENPGNKGLVNHIDHDKSNNTILNLRWVSKAENNMNMLKRADTSSKYKGVYWYKRTNQWHVQIRLNGTRKTFGYYTNEEEAAAKYNEAAVKLFGERALLNSIPGP